MKNVKTRALSFATALAAGGVATGLMAAPAMAHTGGATTGLITGFTHPLLGIDHLLAMLAVGVWAALRPAKSALLGPVVFLVLLAAGALAGRSGLVMPFIEPGILASVVLLGLMVAAGRHIASGAGLAAIAVFALMHGQAHGIAAAGSGAGFIAGMLAVTAVLHLTGYGLGRQLGRFGYGAWIAGSAIASGGLALISF